MWNFKCNEGRINKEKGKPVSLAYRCSPWGTMTLREEEAAESRVARVMADRRLVGLPCAFLLLGAAQRILPDQSRADNVIQKKGHLGITEENCSSRFLSKFTMSTPQQSVGTGTAHQAPRWWVLGSTGNTPSVYSWQGKPSQGLVSSEGASCPRACSWSVPCAVHRNLLCGALENIPHFFLQRVPTSPCLCTSLWDLCSSQ